MKTPRKIRTIILRHHLMSFLASVVILSLFVALVSFDSEDQALEQQMRTETAKLLVPGNEIEPTGTLQGMALEYFLGSENLPEELSTLIKPEWRNNFHEVTSADARHYHINIQDTNTGQVLYVVFDATDYLSAGANLVLYMKVFAIFAFVLLAVTAISARRMSLRISIPLEKLSKKLLKSDTVAIGVDEKGTQVEELNALVQALEDRDERIRSLIQREHQFNRDVSHELRTPLAVASGALEVLVKEGKGGATFDRLSTAVTDMITLTEGVLWLAREPAQASIGAVELDEYCRHAFLSSAQARGLDFRVVADDAVHWPVPESVAKVILANLIRNALQFTKEGAVDIIFDQSSVRVLDTGVGYGNAEPNNQGFGIGLTLVARLCAHYDLEFNVTARKNGGSQALVSWA